MTEVMKSSVIPLVSFFRIIVYRTYAPKSGDFPLIGPLGNDSVTRINEFVPRKFYIILK